MEGTFGTTKVCQITLRYLKVRSHFYRGLFSLSWYAQFHCAQRPLGNQSSHPPAEKVVFHAQTKPAYCDDHMMLPILSLSGCQDMHSFVFGSGFCRLCSGWNPHLRLEACRSMLLVLGRVGIRHPFVLCCDAGPVC